MVWDEPADVGDCETTKGIVCNMKAVSLFSMGWKATEEFLGKEENGDEILTLKTCFDGSLMKELYWNKSECEDTNH